MSTLNTIQSTKNKLTLPKVIESSSESQSRASKVNSKAQPDDDDVISDLDDDVTSTQTEESESRKSNNDINPPNEFKDRVINYLKYDDMIAEKQEQIKELKNKKQLQAEYILRFLEAKGENIITTQSGKLIRNESKTKAPLKVEMIKETIHQEIQDLVKTDKIMELMDQKRPVTTSVNLKRTKRRANPAASKAGKTAVKGITPE
jgi:hypothetical protein